MNAMLLSELIDRLDPAYRLKADLPIELRAVYFSLLYFRHSPLSSREEHRLNRCLKPWVHYKHLCHGPMKF